MILMSEDKILECDNIFFDKSEITGLPVVQAIINDLNPDDSKYVDFVESSDEITVVDNNGISETYKVDKNYSMYIVEYVYDTVQVNINFLVRE